MNQAKIEIAKLVNDYTKKGLVADKPFIFQVINCLVNALQINDYVRDCQFELDNNEELLGAYDCFTKHLYINIIGLINNILAKQSAEKQNGIISTSSDLLLKLNLEIINTIIHELYHALQYKKVSLNKDDLETTLLIVSFEHNLIISSSVNERRPLTPNEIDYIQTLGDLEKKLVYLNALPSERMACINSQKLVTDVSNIVTKKDDIKLYMDIKYQMEVIRGYLNGNCPTAYIMSVHNKLKNSFGLADNLPENLYDNELFCIDLADALNYSLDDKFYLGLYVTKEELKPKLDKINQLTEALIRKK